MSETIIVFSTIAAIMALGFIGDAVSRKILLPNVILLIILGIIFGPILNLFPYDFLIAALPYIASLTLAFISFEAGINMNVYKVLRQSRRAVILSILGFTFSMVAVGTLLKFALGIRWAYAFLMASAWSGLNIAIVNAVCKYIKVREETYATLTIISIVDDPLVLITVLTILNYIRLGGINSRDILLILSSNLSTSIALGAILGIIWINILYFLMKGEYTYTFTLAAIFFVYSLTEIIGGTGVIAIFLFALIIGNHSSVINALNLKISISELSKLKSLMEKFHSEITFMLRSFFFTFIGLIYVFTGFFEVFLALACCFLLHITKYVVAKIGTIGSVMASDLSVMGFIVGQGAASAAMSTLPIVYNLSYATTFTSLALNVILINNITSIVLPYLSTRLKTKRNKKTSKRPVRKLRI
jgi:cell volume regulation protein A